MENLPFFYYDLVARIIPGVLMIAVLRFGGVKLPSEWMLIFQGTEPWKSVVASLVCAGAAYVGGVLIDAIFFLPGLGPIMEWVSRRRFKSAFEEGGYVWRRVEFKPKLTTDTDYIRYRRHAWNWLTLKGAHDPLAFAHAHRFQAEMRLCCYSILPALLFAIFGTLQPRSCTACWLSCSLYFWVGVFVAVILAAGAWEREKRRWIQVLISADHFGFHWPAKPPHDGSALQSE